MNLADSPASMIILILTVIVSLLAFSEKSRIMDWFVLHPYSVFHYKKWYRVFTCGLIHADLAHLLFNMLTLYFFAPVLEQTVGTINFTAIYIGSLFVSSVPTVYKKRDDYNYHSLGASGAISGVLFSYIMFYPTAKIGVMLIPFGMPAYIFAVLYLLYCWYAAKHSQDMINHEAHLWGAISGLILTVFLVPGSINIFLSNF